MPSFNDVAGYLQRVDYCPHLMWDPWTGKVVQFYPANESARALRNLADGVETNRMGKYCIQVEAFFSPGAVVGGKTYKVIADTPCKGLPEIVAWMRGLGIPDVWPAGWPQWTGNSRSVTTWRTQAGHFGHCHVPENDHTDPGPMPRNMFEEDDMPSPKDLWEADIIPAPPWKAEQGNVNWTPASYLHWGYRNQAKLSEKVAELEAKVTEQTAKLDAILAAVTPKEG